MSIIKPKLTFILVLLLLSAVILTGCGGGGGGTGTGSKLIQDDDADGVENSLDVDDDNDGLIEITSLQQLDWMRHDLAGTSLNDGGGNVDSNGCPVGGCNGYELMADLDFNINGDGKMDAEDKPYFDYDEDGQNNGWLPVGNLTAAFAANFEGNNHRISNLYIDRDVTDSETGGGYYIGLFGYIQGSGVQGGGKVTNLVLDGAMMNITGVRYVGGLAGYVSTATIEGNSASGKATGERYLGGLVGFVNNSASIINNTASSEVSGNTSVGGLLGLLINSSMSDNQASGAVTGTSATGGLVGNVLASSISNSQASGDVSGVVSTGGLVGDAQLKSTISNSYASGSVTGSNDRTGGLLGYAIGIDSIINSYATGNVDGSDYTGGLVGKVNNSSTSPDCNIKSSFSTSFVISSATSNYVGGLIGISFQLKLSDSFATGDVQNSNKYVGGLIGDANIGTTISRSFTANIVAANQYVGALVGWSDTVTYVDNYFANNQRTEALGYNVKSVGANTPSGTQGEPLVNLQAATSTDLKGLFTNWGSEWDFGRSNKLPGLVFNGRVYRDGDANGKLD